MEDIDVKAVPTLQRLRARMARRPGRWRRRMNRSRTSASPSTGWAAQSKDDRLHGEMALDAA